MRDAAWEAVSDGHPQDGLKTLLAGLGATRGDVTQWAETPRRPALLSDALLPAAALSRWQDARDLDTAGLFRLEPADGQEEAVSIALVLRDTLQTPGRRAALITPDRALARRVAAELLRWGVVADDSAGEPLGETPPAVFLRLLATAAAAEFAPVPLLALLKHPLTAAGLSPAACRALARRLEQESLRGQRPAPRFEGLRLRVAAARPEVRDELMGFVQRVQEAVAPLLRIAASVKLSPAGALAALIAAGEGLAATDETAGPAILWAQEEGEALAACLAAAVEAFALLPEQRPGVVGPLLDAVLEGQVVRSRRALRGREAGEEHPRVFIWGLLEARLQAVDVAVLGGLAEGVWPPATDPGPWLSRPMRVRAGLPSPEERVGQAAHDFVMASCCAPVAILSCPRRRDGAPSVPARWLVRLEAMLGGAKQRLPRHDAAGWAGLLDQPDGEPRPVPAPRPKPPVELRPRRLRVTEVQTWLEDPYAIYARHVLKLEPLKPLEEETDAADYGVLVHAGMQPFLSAHGADLPPRAAEELRKAMDRALRVAGHRQALAEWWAPRLARIADWVASEEIERRGQAVPVQVASELSGKWPITTAGGPFELRGRADRIDRWADGRLAIFDYKTGAPPSQKQVEAGFAPQLPLEAAMAEAGAFAGIAGQAAELVYWHLSGGYVAGEATSLWKGDADAVAGATRAAAENFRALVATYDDPDRAYLAQPHPGRVPRFPQYAQLARVAEWIAAGDEE
jgi:ATP-dependent helicase/nuclease subunit B